MAEANAIDLLRAAVASARSDDKAKTRRLLLEALRLDPRNETAWQWLAGVAESPLEAVHALERVVELNPMNEKAATSLKQVRLQAGVAAAKAKDAKTARRLLRAVVADQPGNETAWLWLASVAESPQQALAHLQKVLEINPQHVNAKKGVEYYSAQIRQAEAESLEQAATQTVVGGDTKTHPPIKPSAPPARRILVVEDSRTVRKLAVMTLSSVGYDIIEAEDGQDALQQLRDQGVPDLVLLDINMPGMNGYELCKLIRQTPATKSIPVIMLTGKDGLFDKLRGRMAGTDLYLTKPLEPATLLEAVRKYCPAPVAQAS